jgi:hypothetical protein
MKAHGKVDVYIHTFLTSALAGGKWSASRPGRFTPGETAAGTHWIGGWVGPRAGLDDVKKRKFYSYRDSNSVYSMKSVRLLKMYLNGSHEEGEHLSSKIPAQNGLKQGDALTPLLSNSALKYAIREVQEHAGRAET